MIQSMKNVVVFVRDLEKAKKFYRDVMKLPAPRESMTMLEFFSDGGTSLGVAHAIHPDAQKLVGRHTGITLTVSDIDAFCARIAAEGAVFAEPLEATPWGKMAVVKDPDGNLFALVDK